MLLASPGRAHPLRGGVLAAVCAAGLLAGCKTPPLQVARADFYAGRVAPAETNLAVIPAGDKDEILYLMERGTIRQALGRTAASAADYRRAADLDAKLETYSVSQGAASLVVNDRTLAFRGMPFERTLLYAFLAKNYLAERNWDFAAICARNIIKRLEALQGFPDIAYGRYLAGVCLELIDDPGNAAIQYRAAGRLLTNSVRIDAVSGALRPAGSGAKAAPPASAAGASHGAGELVCFVAFGRTPPGQGAVGGYDPRTAPYAELYEGDEYLGRTFPFSNTADLMAASKRRLAAIQMAKDATRVATKVAISEAVKQQNDALGALVWLALFASEAPDTRCWETLPLWLHVARVPCPADLSDFTVVFKSAGGMPYARKTIAAPLVRRGRTLVSFCRDLGP